MPLVVRIERDAPPARTDALETAARAVLTILSDERAVGDGEWAQVMRDWQDARIRKVVRRARGAEWRRAEALPGITVTGKSAEVRVFPPVPLDGWPKDLARLQVSGTDLDDPEPPADAADKTPVKNIEITLGQSDSLLLVSDSTEAIDKVLSRQADGMAPPLEDCPAIAY